VTGELVPKVRPIRNPRARALQGSRAGIVSRCTADGIDFAVVVTIYFGILVAISAVQYLVFQDEFDMPQPNFAVTTGVGWVIAVLYLTVGWASSGRTIGKGMMGLRAVSASGRALSPRRAFFRALLCASFPWVLVPIVFSRRRSGLHDAVLRTAVVYDWTRHT
jgi:uncharacterized RDD family membrane protein YckC